MATRVNIIHPNGYVEKDVYTFVNDKTERYNMVTLYMTLVRNPHIHDERQRIRYEDKIKISKSCKNLFFEDYDGKVYITRLNDK